MKKVILKSKPINNLIAAILCFLILLTSKIIIDRNILPIDTIIMIFILSMIVFLFGMVNIFVGIKKISNGESLF